MARVPPRGVPGRRITRGSRAVALRAPPPPLQPTDAQGIVVRWLESLRSIEGMPPRERDRPPLNAGVRRPPHHALRMRAARILLSCMTSTVVAAASGELHAFRSAHRLRSGS